MASIELRNLSKSFGTLEVIPNLDLTIEDGEFVVFVGPSGCGKSTLLRLIAGLEEVSGGEILIDDIRVNILTPRQRNVAMVFQNYALYPHMPVEQNMDFNLRLSGDGRATIREKVSATAGLLGIDHLLDRLPAHLSGGQRQRVAMGRATVRDPDVFLFDEPLSNLDAQLRVQMRAEVKKLHKRLGRTAIYVTHDQIEAMTLADRIIVFEEGAIAQQGSPEALYEKPANLFVARFIGSPSMNMIEGTVVDGTHALRLADGQALALPAEAEVRSGQRVHLGFRPEHVRPDAAGDTGIGGRILLSEYTGPIRYLTVTLGDTEVVVGVDSDRPVASDETFEGSVEARNLHLFDADTGLRVAHGAELQAAA